MTLLEAPDALAAYGLLQFDKGGPVRADELHTADELRATVERRLRAGYARVHFDEELEGHTRNESDLGAAWHGGVLVYPGDETGRGIRVRLELAAADLWQDLYSALRKASRVSSVFLADYSYTGMRSWHWPLQIGFGPEARLRDQVELYNYDHLIELVDLAQPDSVCDLLIVSDDDLVNVARGTKASVVLSLVDDPERIAPNYAGEVAKKFGASAVAVMTYPADAEQFVVRFLDGLAHNHPVDLAVGSAAQDSDYLVVGDPEFLDSARISGTVVEVRRTIEQSWGDGRLDDVDMAFAMEELSNLESTPWFSERSGATVAATHLSNVKPILDKAVAKHRPRRRKRRGGGRGRAKGLGDQPPRRASAMAEGEITPSPGGVAGTGIAIGGQASVNVGLGDQPPRRAGRSATAEGEVTPSPRYLQSQVYEHRDGQQSRRTHAFRPNTLHDIVVRVGRTSVEWNQAHVEFPTWRLAPDEPEHELTIDLRSPGLFDGMMTQTVKLDRVDDSEPATFSIEVPDSIEKVEIIVSVFCGCLHLQTAVLSGPVGKKDEDSEGTGIRLLRGDGSTVDLEAKEDVHLSFTKEKDVIKVRQEGEQARLLNLPGIDQEVGKLREALFEAATGIQQLETALDEEDGLNLLVTLADHGWELRKKLVGEAPLPEVTRVLASSPASSDYLPVELLYDYGLPQEDAQLCRKFLGTKNGACEGCDAEGDSAYVCPSGFWGLRRHVEQRVWAEATGGRDSTCLAPMASGAMTILPSVDEIVVAASNKVNEGDTARVKNLVGGLKEAIGDETPSNHPAERVHLASDWKEWKKLVKNHFPALLVTLPHKVETPLKREALQIAHDKELAVNRISRAHVVPEGAVGPVVLLLGCNTANPEVQYQDFIHKFRCEGAVLVVGTLTYVLGPEMAHVAKSFVQHLWAAGGQESFGEIMQRVRASMLREGNVMALALVAYGDADWRFTTGGG